MGIYRRLQKTNNVTCLQLSFTTPWSGLLCLYCSHLAQAKRKVFSLKVLTSEHVWGILFSTASQPEMSIYHKSFKLNSCWSTTSSLLENTQLLWLPSNPALPPPRERMTYSPSSSLCSDRMWLYSETDRESRAGGVAACCTPAASMTLPV